MPIDPFGTDKDLKRRKCALVRIITKRHEPYYEQFSPLMGMRTYPSWEKNVYQAYHGTHELHHLRIHVFTVT